MKYTASVLITLALVCTGGCRIKSFDRNEPSPTPDYPQSSTKQFIESTGSDETLPSPSLATFEVEFVSNPLRLPIFPFLYGFGPMIAVGDVTGDDRPEVLLAMQGERHNAETPEDAFWRHPVVLSWNGKTFEPLEADWLGIPSHSENLETYLAQGLPHALLVLDLDYDGTNEVIVGTAPYRTAFQERGAVYVFQWDGKRFVAEFSEYCLGAVQRLDAVAYGNDMIVVASVRQRPVTDWDAYKGLCPQLPKGPDEPTRGLYAIQASGPGEYQTWPLTIDDGLLTALVIGSGHLSGTQFIRLHRLPSTFLLEWAGARVTRYDGQVYESDAPLEVTNHILQMEAIDLNSDRIDEIVVLAAKDKNQDVLVWQVFQMMQGHYHLVHEQPLVYPDPLRSIFAVGDADNDGLVEIISDSGSVYKWVNDRLCYQANLLKEIGQDMTYGLESVHIEDVYGNGQNKIVFTRRYSSEGEPCLDCSAPWMYVVGMSSDLPVVECP